MRTVGTIFMLGLFTVPNLGAAQGARNATICSLESTGLGPTCTSRSQSRWRITQPITNAQSQILPNTIHPQVRIARDLGRVDALAPLEQMLLVLKASPEQNVALEQLLAEQHDPGSANYQQWLTPEQFGERFGAAQEDLEAISSWLRSQGFVVHDFAAGRRTIEFSGITVQVEKAFHTEMHHYEVNGRKHIANATDLAIPAALADVVEGISLHSFRAQPQHRFKSAATFTGTTAPSPQSTLSGGSHALTPYDYATIYNIAPLWNAGTDGAGQTIAIVGRSLVSQSDFAAFRSLFGLPPSTLQMIGTNYATNAVDSDDTVEATLDVEWAGGVAKGANILLVASTGSQTTDGLELAASYAVNNNLAPILSLSFAECETYLGAGNAFYENLWRQAASQGISVVVATGDNGAAGCDDSSSTAASHGLGVNGLASTAYNVAVGGTEFNEGPGAYWNAANDWHVASATSYIPEQAWNEGGLWAGSGGVSTEHLSAAWETGPGVPASDPNAASQHHRFIPDVSLTAAVHDGYLIVAGGNLAMMGGTSASAPSFAGIMALVNQRTGARNGLPNPLLYALAQSVPSVFHDTTVGSNAVPCVFGTDDCSGGVLSGYRATAGYDLATGWGSVDANALVSNWAAASPAPTIRSVTPTVSSELSQTLTITGSGFQPGAQVVTSYEGGSPVILEGDAIAAATSVQLQVSLNVDAVAHTWNLQVINPNNEASNTVAVTVAGRLREPRRQQR